MRLRPVALGVSLGAVWGASVFVVTWGAVMFGYGREFLLSTAGSI